MYSKINKLPHGSGIDYDWEVERGKYRGRIAYIYKNYYHYMDSFGGYNGIIPFRVYYDKDFKLINIKLFCEKEYLIEIGSIELFDGEKNPSKKASYEAGKSIIDGIYDYFLDIFPQEL